MNLIKLFRPSGKVSEGMITAPSKSLVRGSMTLQITLLMEQYIQNQNLIVSTNSSEDYATLINEYDKLYSLDLGNTKNARILKERIDKYNESYQNKVKAEKLISFIKKLRNHFGDSTLLISSEQFEKICKKYNLETGLLCDYTGIIPDKNIKEIKSAKEKIREFKGSLNHTDKNAYLWKITECTNSSLGGDSIFDEFVTWIQSRNNLVFANIDHYNFDNSIWLMNMRDVNPDIPLSVKNYKNKALFKAEGKLIDKYTMFIACPPEQLKAQTIKITKKAVDPIVFQYSPYGIVVHSIWGEEAEDIVFEEYKRVNQLLSL